MSEANPQMEGRSREVALDSEPFDVFISYSTRSDYLLARDLERFLSKFHQLPGIEKHSLTPLRVCVDGSTFLQRRQGRVRRVDDVVQEHLARSRQLLVLCSTGAVDSPAVHFEVQSFLDADLAGDVHLAVTEGADPSAAPEAYFPEPVRTAGLVETIWFDLRGFHKRAAREWFKVRDFGRERVRLAAELLAAVGKSRSLTAAELYPDWLEQEQRATRRRLGRIRAAAAAFAIVAILATGLGAIATVLRELSEVRRRAAHARSLVALEPEQALGASAAAWSRLQEREWRSRATGLRGELATAREEVLQSLFTSLTGHPGFRGSLGAVRANPLVAGSADGRLIAVADASGAAPVRSRIELWQLESDDYRKVEERWLEGRVLCLDLTASGHSLLAVTRRYAGIYRLSAGGTVEAERTVDLATAEHADVSCSSAVLDAAGASAWIGTNEGRIVRLATTTGAMEDWADDLGGIVNALAFEPTGEALIAAVWTRESSLRLVPAVSGGGSGPFVGVEAPARALALVGSDTLVSGHEDGTVAVWNGRRLVAARRLSTSPVVDVVGLASGGLFVLGSEAGELLAFDLSGGGDHPLREVSRIRLFRGPVTSLVATVDGGVLAASPLATVRRWLPGGTTPIETILAARTSQSRGLAAAPGEEKLWAFGDAAVVEWQPGARGWSSPQEVFNVDPAEQSRSRIAAVAPGTKRVVMLPQYGNPDGRLRVAVAGSREPPQVLSGAVNSMARVAFSPSENLLAAGLFERPQSILVWSLDSPQSAPVRVGDAAGGPVAGLAFSPDGMRLAASDLTGCVRMWTLASAAAGSDRLECRDDDQPGALAWDAASGHLAIGWISPDFSPQLKQGLPFVV